MGDINLKEAFQKTDPTGSEYWTFSSDSHVQFEQLQGAQGNRSPISVSTPHDVTGLHDQKEKQKKKDAELLDLLSAMEAAERLFSAASQAAQRALDGLEKTIDKFKTELNDLREEFDQNTVTLSDGTKAYYNTENSEFEQQDAHGDWHALDNEEAIEEAFQKAKAQGGLVSTKQGKQALDEQQQSLDKGTLFIATQHDKLAELNQIDKNDVENLNEATQSAQGIAESSDSLTNDIYANWNAMELLAAPAEIHVTNQSQVTYKQDGLNEQTNQAGNSADESLFAEDDVSSPSSTAPSPF